MIANGISLSGSSGLQDAVYLNQSHQIASEYAARNPHLAPNGFSESSLQQTAASGIVHGLKKGVLFAAPIALALGFALGSAKKKRKRK